MAKNWKKLIPYLAAIVSLLFPSKIVSQAEGLPITLLKGIDQVGRQLIQNRQRSRPNQSFQSSPYAPRPIPSKYFPRCKINMGRSNFPQNVCRKDLPTGGAIGAKMSEAQGFKKIALNNISFLESLLTPGQESMNPIGLQCLQEASQKKLSDIQNVINRLKLESIKIKKGFEEFNQRNRNLILEMKKVNAELRGGADQIDNLNRDFAQDFSPVCRDIFTAKVLATANQKGLLGIKNNPELTEKYDLANNAYNNEGIWKQELRDKIKKVKDKIIRYGPSVLVEPAKMGLISEKSDLSLDKTMSIAIAKSYAQFKNEYDDINAQMKKNLKHSLPPLDENFYKNISHFAKSSQKYFKKKLVHECVVGNKYGLAIDSKKILQGLKQSNSTTQGTNVINYRNQLQQILNQDSFFGDKMAAIRKLDKIYNGVIVYTYRDTRAGVVSKPPSEIFKATIQACTRQIGLDNTFARNPSQGGFVDIKQIDGRLKRLSQKAKTFPTNIANDIYQRVANCNGRVLKSGSCNKKTLNSQEEGFCIAHAASCANAVRSCHQELGDKINVRINTLKVMGKKWDDAAKTFITQQQNYLNTALFPPVAMIMEQIRKHLPGATVELNADTFIKLPSSEISQEFGISMLGGGSLEEFQQLPKLIEKNLIGMLKDQKRNLEVEYKKYIADKRQSINSDLQRWKGLKTACTSLESQIAATAEKINRARQKAWNENRAAARNFCTQYDSVRQNPAAGCDTLKELYGNSVRTSGMIDPGVNVHLGRFMAYCNEFNNEQNNPQEEHAESKLKDFCEKYDNRYEDIKEPLTDMALTTVSEEYKDSVSDYLQNRSPDIDLIKALSSQQRRYLRNVHRLLHPADDDYNVSSTAVDELVRGNLRSKNEAYRYFNSGTPVTSPALFKEWKNQTGPLSIKDLFKIREQAPSEKLSNFFIDDPNQAKKMIKLLQNATSLKIETTDLCVKHMNHALYQAAKNCAEKDSGNQQCLKNELDETSWSPQLTDLEKKLSQLVDYSKDIVAQELGEQAQGRCEAPLGKESRRKKPSIMDFLFPDGKVPSILKGIGI